MNKVKDNGPSLSKFLAVIMGAVLATSGAGPTAAQESQTGGKAIGVEVVNPKRRTLVRKLNLPATLRADEVVDLFAKTSGYVEMIDVDIGSRVKKGDLLVQISVPEMVDELRQFEAIVRAKTAKVRALQAKSVQAQRMVETAETEVRRYAAEHALEQISLKRKRELRDGNAIPEQALDEAVSAHAITEAQLQIAHARVAGAIAEKQAVDADVDVAQADMMVVQANLARLKTLMEYASIRAPFDGVITVRGVDHGAFVRSAEEGTTTSLLRIAKMDRIRVVIEIPEIDAPFVKAGTAVDINIKALRQKPFTGSVSRTAHALKPATRTMRAEVDIDNTEGKYAPGMYALVVVELESNTRAMMIPSKAIRMEGKNTIVLVSAGGVARSKPVKIGYDDGIWAEVLSGLDEQDLVITSTSGAVAPGVAVESVLSDS